MTSDLFRLRGTGIRERVVRRLPAAGLILWISAAALPAGSVVQRSTSSVLQAGRPEEREIAGGEQHSYSIVLAAGDYLEISIQPQGVELVSELLMPDGAVAATVNASHSPGSPLAMVYVAGIAGTYSLRIRPVKTDAAAGRYRLTMTEPRAATAEETGRFNARREFAEGQRLALANAAEQNRQAVTHYTRAVELFREVGDRKWELTAMMAVAETHVWFGDPQEALDCYQQALLCARESGDRYGEANIHLGVGRILATFGNHQEAVAAYNRALEMYRGMSAKYGEALALSLLGSVHRILGDPREALDLYERALPTFDSLGDKHNEGTLLNLIGLTYAGMGDLAKALEFHTRALAIARQENLYRLAAPTLGFLGNAHIRLGDRGQAVEDYRESLKIAQAAGLRDTEATALRFIAEAGLADGNLEDARALLIRALEIFRSLGLNPEMLRTLALLAEVRYSAGAVSEARQEIEEALEIGESLWSRVLEPELRQTFFASLQNCFQLYIDILMRMHADDPSAGMAAAALSVSERARARSLLELLNEAGVDLRHGVPADVLGREQSLRLRLNAKAAARERVLGDRRTAAQAASFEADIAGLASQYREVEAQIRSSSPAYALLTQPQPLTAAEIQDLLDPSTVLLEFSLGDKRSWLWAVSHDAIESHQLPPRDAVEAACRKVYAAITAQRQHSVPPARLEAETGALSDLLFSGIAARLRREWKDARLVIVASGALEYTPICALPLPAGGVREPLIRRHEIVTLPSASALAVMRARAPAWRAPSKILAILADPVVDSHDPRLAHSKPGEASGTPGGRTAEDGAAESLADAEGLGRSLSSFAVRGWRNGFSRLPFSREEADRIASLVPQDQCFKGTGFQASRATAISGALSRYRIVHFATHGLLNSENPELSGLVLSLFDRSGKPQDGFLRMNEIYNLDMPADLVVLSACQTALGKEIRGEGMIGLTRGFMYAGARRVVASLWQVDDLATAELMARFYRGMLNEKLRPAEALRRAQLEMAGQKRWSSPYFWAGFTLQGEWR